MDDAAAVHQSKAMCCFALMETSGSAMVHKTQPGSFTFYDGRGSFRCCLSAPLTDRRPRRSPSAVRAANAPSNENNAAACESLVSTFDRRGEKTIPPLKLSRFFLSPCLRLRPSGTQTVINTMCGFGVQTKSHLEADKSIYPVGCVDKAVVWIESHLLLVGALALGLALPQVRRTH
ncbi:Tetraspanin-33 [Liparis tanakae]|uniref:Tetraspanin-33 n=1 Tax=Liparis tanakae TaxID=230148 RepID=A0A4Z2G950_9TELE|nr:Tetraspanin-33 [Liparis tanakae]